MITNYELRALSSKVLIGLSREQLKILSKKETTPNIDLIVDLYCCLNSKKFKLPKNQLKIGIYTWIYYILGDRIK